MTDPNSRPPTNSPSTNSPSTSRLSVRLDSSNVAGQDVAGQEGASARRAKKVSAWIGSVFVHSFLLLLILYWFSLPNTNRSAPGERGAVGSIVLQSGGDARRQDGQQAGQRPNEHDLTEHDLTDPELLANLSERLATTVLDVRPATVLAPGQSAQTFIPNADSNQAAANLAASSLEGAFQGVHSGGSIGIGVGSQSGATTVQLFGKIDGTGTKFVYVFDRSASMAGQRMQRAKAELIRSLGALSDSHQFNIIFYSGHPETWRPGPPRRLVYATPVEKQNAVRFIESITPSGGTRHYEPLLEAINYRPDVIFFLTDGESQDDLTPVQLRNIEQTNSRFGRGSQINVIQFGSGGFTERPSRILEQLANENYGEYLYLVFDSPQ